jgi:hypothetical protein
LADSFVDYEHSVNTSISKVGKALQDNPQRPLYAETLRRSAHRFPAAVEETERRFLMLTPVKRRAKFPLRDGR